MMNGEATKAARQIYYWVHHTGRYDGNTGVQRVVRSLGAALANMPGVESCRFAGALNARRSSVPRQPGPMVWPDTAGRCWRSPPKRAFLCI